MSLEHRDELLLRAGDFLASRHYAEALFLCDLILREGADADALRVKGKVLTRVLKAAQAVEVLSQACRLAPRQPANFVALAQALRALDRMQEALDAVDEAVRLAPEAFDARNLRGWLRARLGDEPGAAFDYEAAMRAMPRSARRDEVRAHLRELAAEAGRRRAGGGDAVAYARSAFQAGAVEYCLDFIAELGPAGGDAADLLFLKALCLARLGRRKEAQRVPEEPLLAAAMTPAMRRELEVELNAAVNPDDPPPGESHGPA